MAAAGYQVQAPGIEEHAKAEQVPAKKPTRFYAPELDALRFVAFLLVFCRHVTTNFGLAQRQVALSHAPAIPAPVAATGHAAVPALSPMWAMVQGVTQSFDFGVCLFFFLSSFLITRLLLIEREKTGTIEIRNFYIRRSLRIWPLYFSFIAAVVVLSQFLPVLAVTPSRVIVSLLFVSNWAAVLHGWGSSSIQVLWSVSVEEQFYVVWPVLARIGKRAIVILSSALTLVSLGTLFYLGHHAGTEVTAVWPNTLVQCIFFAGGAFTAVFSFPERRKLHPAVRVLSMIAGFACWVIASAVCHVVRTESPGSLDLMAGFSLVLLGTFLIFTGVAGWNQRPIPKWLIHLGRISYGLYVFHVCCMLLTDHSGAWLAEHLHRAHASLLLTQGVSGLIGLALTIVCALLSYQFLELPFLKLKDRFTVVPSRPD